MAFDPHSEIQDQESLFRHFHFLQWHTTENRLSTAAFQQSNGTSVDREGERSEDEIISDFRKRPNLSQIGIAKLTAIDCREVDAVVLPAPEPENKYHAQIQKNETTPKITRGQANRLSRKFSLVIQANESH